MKFALKKVLLFLLAGAFLLASGCVPKDGVYKSTGDEPYTIKWYNLGPEVRDMDEVFEQVSKYTMDKIGVNVSCTNIIPGEYVNKLQLMFAANEKFDICHSAEILNFYTNVMRDAYLPLDDLINKYGKDMLKEFPEFTFTGGIVNGKLYAIPAYKEFSVEYFLTYNISDMAELSKERGLDVSTIKSLADIEPFLAAYKEKYPDRYGFNVTATYLPFQLLGFIPVADTAMVASMDIHGDGETIINPYETEKAQEYMKLMHKWYKLGYIRKDVATTSGFGGKGKSLFGHQELLPYQKMMENELLDEESKQGTIELDGPWMLTTAGSMQSIPRSSENPQKAMEFLNLLNTDPYLRNLVAHGIEGKHYIAVGDTRYRFPEGKKREEVGYFSYPYTQGNMYITRQIEGTPDDIYDKYREMDERALKSPMLGFRFNGEELPAQIAGVQNVYQEFMKGILTGAADPEVYLPRALEKFKSSGLDEIILEAQKQFDSWKAATRR